jgi:putative multiple sugar transport system substrate-binding protein
MLGRRAFVAVLLVLAVSGCGGDDGDDIAAAPDRGSVGIAMPTKKSERWIADGDNLARQFTLLGYRPDVQYADDDVKAQVAQLDAMVAGGAKALVVAAIDGTALKDVLGRAAAAKIPVIAYDRLIRDSADLSYYATFDNFKVGVLQGAAILDGLKGKGPFNVELFAGSADDNNATFFFNGAMSVLRWDGAVAKQRMARLLAAHYRSARVDAVLSPYDGLSRGILDALGAAGYGGSKKVPVITGQDAELDSVKLIAAGKQTETVYKDTRELAKVTVQMTNSLLTGGRPEVNDTEQYNNGVKVIPTFLLQPVNVDKSNYRRVLVDSGYYTAAEVTA